MRASVAGSLLLAVLWAAPTPAQIGRGGGGSGNGRAPQVATPQRIREILAFADAGRSKDAEDAARAGGPEFRVTLADLLLRRGELKTADSLYNAVVNDNGAYLRPALAGLADIAAIRGDRETSWRLALELTSAYQQGGNSWSAIDKIAAGRAYWILGLGNASSLRAALRAFDDAAKADPANLDAKLLAADLLLEKYNAPDARDSYLDVLKQVPLQSRALFGIARTMVFEGLPDATTAIRHSLAGNPELAPGWVLLGQLHLEAEQYDSASAAAKHALAIDSTTSATWGLVGSIAFVLNDTVGYRRAEAAAKRQQPKSADFYVAIGEAAARQRRYQEAITLARTALAIDSLSLSAIDLLAANLLRQGEMAEGRKMMDRSWALNPFNIWNDNTLKLLDRLNTYKTVKSGHFEFVAPPGEADYLALYLAPLLEQAYSQFSKRYEYTPPGPVRIELYDHHADFSVRTVAMPGLGALGVSFGPVLVLDSPHARAPGEFNYGSTAWHELAHTFTLGASGFRIPRWMSEGLSVLEERRTGRGWGENVTLDFLAAFKGGHLHHVSDLNDGMVRPSYPVQIMHSYYEASLVCEMFEEMKGEAGIRAMLKGFKDGKDAPTVFRQVLGLSPAALDSTFDHWVNTRFAVPLAAIYGTPKPGPATGPYVDAIHRGISYLEQGAPDSAFASLQQADKLYPDYPGVDGAARWLARYYLDQADTAQTIKQLARVTSVVEDVLDLNQVEARLQRAHGDKAGELATLDRLQWIAPDTVSNHITIAEAHEASKDWPKALMERRAVIALNPPDKIEARYQLARVLAASGDTASARTEVLAVLEMAPAFEKAQALLLQLRRPPSPGDRQ